jgi:hypothetical protein
MFYSLIVAICHDTGIFYDRPQILTFIRLNTFSALAKVDSKKALT